MQEEVSLPDQSQSFWQIASIQGLFGLSTIILGGQLSKIFGAGAALVSAFIGSVALWIIGISIVAMGYYAGRKNAIETIEAYFGKVGAILGAFALAAAFIFWFAFPLTITAQGLSQMFTKEASSWALPIRTGSVIGLVASLLAIWGIKILRRTAPILLTLSVIFMVGIVLTTGLPVFRGTWGISFLAIAMTMTSSIPWIIHFPTFFRHAKTDADARLGVSILMLINFLVLSLGIFAQITDVESLLSLKILKIDGLNQSLLATFLVISTLFICIRIIYALSAVWETLLPRLGSEKENAIIGMLGTVGFMFLLPHISKTMLIASSIDRIVACLVALLVVMGTYKIFVKHELRGYEKALATLTCILGAVGTIVIIQPFKEGQLFATVGSTLSITFTLFLALTILFFGQAIWSGKNVFLGKRK